MTFERHPVAVTKPCFGLEHLTGDPVCETCEYQAACVTAMGKREGRVTLDKAVFKLHPPEMPMTRLEEPVDPDPQTAYANCYQQVFHGVRPDVLTKLDPNGSKLRSLARDLGVSVKLYTLAAMIGHKKATELTNENQRFYARMLLGPVAQRRVEMYRSAAANEFGVFDPKSLEALTGGDKEILELERKLHDSELTAALWVVNRKIRWAGDPKPELYKYKELGLDPLWLALESSYRDTVFANYIKTRDGSEAQIRHRMRVAQAIKELKHKKLVEVAYDARSRIMPNVIAEVLRRQELSPKDFSIASPVTDAIRFWSRLGLAIQHVLCLRVIEGDLDALHRLRVQSI